MKPLLVLATIVSTLASCSTHKLESQEMALASLVGGESSQMIESAAPLESRNTFAAPWFEPVAPPITDAKSVSRITRSLADGEVYDIGKTPFAGHLCHVALLGPDGEVVALVSIVDSESRCLVGEASRDALGRIRQEPGVNRVAVQSDEFVRIIYSHLNSTVPEYLNERRKLYGLIGRATDPPTLQTKQGEQDGAGQPAARSDSE